MSSFANPVLDSADQRRCIVAGLQSLGGSMCYGHTVFAFFAWTNIGPPWGVSQRWPPLFQLMCRRRVLPCVFGLAMKSPLMNTAERGFDGALSLTPGSLCHLRCQTNFPWPVLRNFLPHFSGAASFLLFVQFRKMGSSVTSLVEMLNIARSCTFTQQVEPFDVTCLLVARVLYTTLDSH